MRENRERERERETSTDQMRLWEQKCIRYQNKKYAINIYHIKQSSKEGKKEYEATSKRRVVELKHENCS